MFTRLRQLRISLATKCQILFGAAVVLIVAAALFVPWRRIEQLTEQLNESAAIPLVDYAIAQHIQGAIGTGDTPTTRPVSHTSAPTSRPLTLHSRPAPRILLIPLDVDKSGNSLSHASGDAMYFERHALAYFTRHSEAQAYSAYYQRDDGTEGYRYAQRIRFNNNCTACHITEAAASAHSTTRSTTAPAELRAVTELTSLAVDPITRWAGIISVDIGSRTDSNERLLNRAFIFAAGLLAGTLAIVTFYLITTRLILQPVRVLQETAEKVSHGDLNIRSDINTGDEFQQLSDTFNVMLTNLKRSTDQLRSVNKSLDLKLGQLAEANMALYESNRLKSEFLANVSHELRTPLNSILGFADLLKDAADAPAESRTVRYINNILRSGRSLLDLINDLLDLAKIEAGRMEIRSEPLSLSDLFEGLIALLKPLSEQKNLQIHPMVAANVPILHSDPGKLQQVLYNFLSNAIKFSPEGQSIELSASLEGSAQVRVTVSDHGPGIAPEQHDVIFEKFRQVDGSVTRSHGGTGLGLAISKELVTLMSGSIGVQSTPGAGATFWILLPIQIQPGQVDVRGRLILA